MDDIKRFEKIAMAETPNYAAQAVRCGWQSKESISELSR